MAWIATLLLTLLTTATVLAQSPSITPGDVVAIPLRTVTPRPTIALPSPQVQNLPQVTGPVTQLPQSQQPTQQPVQPSVRQQNPPATQQPAQQSEPAPPRQQPSVPQAQQNQKEPAPPISAEKKPNIIERLKQSKIHSVFLNVIASSNLTKVFASTQDITVFAPTDAGFYTTLRDLRYRNLGDPSTVAQFWNLLLERHGNFLNFSRIVSYHVGRGRLKMSDIGLKRRRFADSFVATLSGDKFDVKDGYLKDNAQPLPNPNFTAPLDVEASNGNIHSIDRVLWPFQVDRKELRDLVVELQKDFSPARNVCFPLSATVRMDNGDSISMRDLDAGHHVHVSERGIVSPVYLFSHRLHHGLHEFVRLTAESGHSISLSPAHYLYANDQLTAASAVRIGDVLRTVDGPSRVTRVDMVHDVGLVAPHTMHGDIVVDGVVVSSYTMAVHPRVAEILLAPLRAVVRMGLAKEPLGSLLYNGADHMAQYLPSGPERY